MSPWVNTYSPWPLPKGFQSSHMSQWSSQTNFIKPACVVFFFSPTKPPNICKFDNVYIRTEVWGSVLTSHSLTVSWGCIWLCPSHGPPALQHAIPHLLCSFRGIPSPMPLQPSAVPSWPLKSEGSRHQHFVKLLGRVQHKPISGLKSLHLLQSSWELQRIYHSPILSIVRARAS